METTKLTSKEITAQFLEGTEPDAAMKALTYIIGEAVTAASDAFDRMKATEKALNKVLSEQSSKLDLEVVGPATAKAVDAEAEYLVARHALTGLSFALGHKHPQSMFVLLQNASEFPMERG